MKNTSNKTGQNNAAATLAQLNAQIEDLKQKRIGLAEPLKARYSELRTELLETENQIRDLDETWKPASLKPEADAKIVEVLTASEKPMSADEIIQAVGSVFSPWKVKSTLKKKSTGAKAVLAVNDGRYSVKAA